MRNRLLSLLFLVALVSEESATGQEVSTPSISQTPTTGHFNKAVVFRRQQNAVAGYLVGVKNDTLILLAGGRHEKVPRQDLLKVVVDIEQKSGTIGAYGMLFGIYLGNFIFFSADNQPTAYFDSKDFRDSELGTLLANVAFATAGGLLGYLVDATLEKEKVFDFTGKEPEQQAEWQRLHKFSLREKSTRKVDFNLRVRLNNPTPPYGEIAIDREISKTLSSGVVFTGLHLYPSNFLALGLIADYVFVPTERAPGIPAAGIPAQNLRLGNASLGFTIGMHF